jgi:hypothetical protein
MSAREVHGNRGAGNADALSLLANGRRQSSAGGVSQPADAGYSPAVVTGERRTILLDKFHFIGENPPTDRPYNGEWVPVSVLAGSERR